MYSDLLLSFSFVVGSKFVKQFPIHFHEGFEDIIDESYNGLIPVLLGDFVKGWEHDGEDYIGVLLDQAHYVIVVPIVQGPLCHLKYAI